MEQYTIEAKAYNKTYGIVSVRKCFKGERANAYENAMQYAYSKAKKFRKAGVEFSVTIQGKDWRTAMIVNPA